MPKKNKLTHNHPTGDTDVPLHIIIIYKIYNIVNIRNRNFNNSFCLLQGEYHLEDMLRIR